MNIEVAQSEFFPFIIGNSMFDVRYSNNK